MNYILIIFLKELKEVIRDKRTLMAMLVFPLLLVPSILSVSMTFQASQSEEAMTKELKIGFIDNGNGEEFKRVIGYSTDIKLIEGVAEKDLKALVKSDSLDAALVLATTFDAAIRENRTAKIAYYYNSTDANEIKQRIEGTIEAYEQNLLKDRLEALKLMDDVINPVEVEKKDIYTQEESLGKMIGGFLPYIFVLFCLMGAMYPTIDLFTGEKERNTIETLLTVPANRLQILLGKMGVVVISGVVSGLMAIIGLYIAMKVNPDAEEVFVNIVNRILEPTSVGLIIAMLIPLTIFFGGTMVPIAIYAKSYKEAQSMIQPGMIVVIMPLVIGMMPGVQLNFGTALIPILNVALASKEIIAGTIDYGLLAVVFISLVAIAAIGVLLSIRQFSKESNVLR
jgi:sodium transport system permease protein